jgi:hypothetical protein
MDSADTRFPPPSDDFVNLPCAANGLTSYRCRGRYGWIMIGARDHEGAMREARRSSDTAERSTLEVWNGMAYVPAL